MKVGLIGRSNKRGLGSQTYEFWRGYKPDAVLHVLDDNPRWPEDPGLYPDAYTVKWTPGEPFEQGPLIDFMAGLDVIFSVETLYDWSLVHMANNRSIRTVVQGNPEFMRHERLDWADTPHPTIWCFPTPWLIDQMPSQRILPVPVPEPIPNPPKPGALDDEYLTVVHVAGHRAAGDRNGTDLVTFALNFIKTKVRFRIIGQDGPNTIFREMEIQHGDNVELELIETGLENRWDLYEGAHLVALPRRYGGLCLPAIEAMSVGVVPMMPNCPPNPIWPIEILPGGRGRAQLTPFGMVETELVNPMQMAHRIDDINRARDYLATKRDEALAWAAENTWDRLRPLYDQLFSDRP
jgi:hypothetical protein